VNTAEGAMVTEHNESILNTIGRCWTQWMSPMFTRQLCVELVREHLGQCVSSYSARLSFRATGFQALVSPSGGSVLVRLLCRSLGNCFHP